MNALISKATRVLIQGITGHEGSTACQEMLSYGTKIVAGVTPGKGGQEVQGVPVYNTVRAALAAHPEINTSLVAVPAGAVLDAAREALTHGVGLVNILAEHVPARDAAEIVAWSRYFGKTVVGPSSVGILNAAAGVKLGSIGSGSTRHVFTPGPVAVVSKSGGMTAEISVTLSRVGLGQSTVVGIGGDTLVGFNFVDALKVFRDDFETRVVVLFGEVGGSYEEEAAEYIAANKYPKPVIAIVAGRFTSMLTPGTVLGHAGAIVGKGRGDYLSKRRAFEVAGVPIAEILDEVPGLITTALKLISK